MATILAHIQLHPGKEEAFEAITRELFTETHATEAAVRHYDYWRAQTPGLYYCLLAVEDHPAFIAHQASDHHEEASPKLGELIADIRLEWVDPVAGASKLDASRAAPLPEGASKLEERMARFFPVDVAEWWPARD